MGIHTFYSRTLVAFHLLVYFLPVQNAVAVAQKQSPMTLQQESFDRIYPKIESLIESYSDQDLATLLAKADYFSSEAFLYPILHSQAIKHQAMEAFRDKLLYQIDTYEALPGIPTVGIYTKDIISLLLYGGVLLDEKLLLRIYTDYIVNHSVEHLLQLQLPATSATQEEFHDEEQTSTLLSFFTPTIFNSFQGNLKGIATSRCLTSHVWHAALSLFINSCKNHYLLAEDNPIQVLLPPSTHKPTSGPKPLFSLIKETLLIEIPLNIPDATVIHMAIQALSSYHLLPSACHHNLLQLSKNIISSLLFLYFFTKNFMFYKWKHLLKESYEEIVSLLHQYHKSQTDPETKPAIKNRLKQLVSLALAPTYTIWLKEKHRYITRIDACYYAIFLILVIYKGVSWAYNFYKTATQEPSQGTAT